MSTNSVEIFCDGKLKSFDGDTPLKEVLQALKLQHLLTTFVHGGQDATKKDLRKIILDKTGREVSEGLDKPVLIQMIQEPEKEKHKVVPHFNPPTASDARIDVLVEILQKLTIGQENQQKMMSKHQEQLDLLIQCQLKGVPVFNMAEGEEEEETEEEEEDTEGDKGAGEPASEEKEETAQATISFNGKTKIIDFNPGMEMEAFVAKAKRVFKLGDEEVYFTKEGRCVRKVPRNSFEGEMTIRMIGGGPKQKRARGSSASANVGIYRDNYADEDEPMGTDDVELFRKVKSKRSITMEEALASMGLEELERLAKLCEDRKGHLGDKQAIIGMASFLKEPKELEEMAKTISKCQDHIATLWNTALRKLCSNDGKEVMNYSIFTKLLAETIQERKSNTKFAAMETMMANLLAQQKKDNERCKQQEQMIQQLLSQQSSKGQVPYSSGSGSGSGIGN